MTNRAEIRIRRASVADAGLVAEINVAGWRAAYRGIMPAEFLAGLSVSARRSALEARLAAGEQAGAPAWVAELGGRGIGYLSSGPPRDADVPPPAAEVYALYVVPEEWRGGAGRALLTTAVDYWLDSGATTLVLWVLEANARARAFYEALGWRPDGLRQDLELGGFTTPELRYRLSR